MFGTTIIIMKNYDNVFIYKMIYIYSIYVNPNISIISFICEKSISVKQEEIYIQMNLYMIMIVQIVYFSYD